MVADQARQPPGRENVTYGLNSIAMSGGTSPDRAVLDSALLRVGSAGLGSH
jgi:hypothetical protein